MNFDFDEVFKRHSEIELKRISAETMKTHLLDPDPINLAVTLSAKSAELALVVTRSVFQEYHETLMKSLKESR